MPCFLWHLTCGGRRPHFAPDWTVQLLTAVYWNADAQQGTPQLWFLWLPIEHGARAWCILGGLN